MDGFAAGLPSATDLAKIVVEKGPKIVESVAEIKRKVGNLSATEFGLVVGLPTFFGGILLALCCCAMMIPGFKFLYD